MRRLSFIFATLALFGLEAEAHEKKNVEPPIEKDAFGDPLPVGAVARLGTVRFRYANQSQVPALAYFPDGNHIATAGQTICIWETASGKMIRRLDANYGWATVIMSPDGKTLATSGTKPGGHADEVIRLWEAGTGREIRQLAGKEYLFLPRKFSADGRTLTSMSYEGVLQLWDVSTGQEIRKFTGLNDPGKGAWFSPDGTLLVAGKKDGSLHLWESATGKELRRWPTARAESTFPAFSPDNKLLAWRATDGIIRVVETATGKEIRQLKTPKWSAAQLAFSSDNKTLAGADSLNPNTQEGGSKILFWSMATGEQIRELIATNGISAMAFSPDQKSFAAVGDDCLLRVWDLTTGKTPSDREGHTRGVAAVAFTRDGRTVVSASGDGTVRRWDAVSGKLIGQFATTRASGMLDARVLSPDGRLFAQAQGPRVWEVATGKPQTQVAKIESFGFAAAFSHDGKKLAIGGRATKVLDVATGKEITQVVIDDDLAIHTGVAFSPDGETLAMALQDGGGRFHGSIAVADRTGKVLGRFAPLPWGLYGCVAYSADSKLLAAGPGNLGFQTPGLCVWDVATGNKVKEMGKPIEVQCVAFSRDGQTLAGGCGQDIVLWDVATGKEIRRLKGHQGSVTSLAFSQDGARMASGSADTTVLIWSVEQKGTNK